MTSADIANLWAFTYAATIGTALHVHRVAAGLTQADLGSAAGVTGPYICRIEAGERKPSLGCLQRLADGLDVNLVDLLGPRLSAPSTDHVATFTAIVADMVRRPLTDPERMLFERLFWESAATLAAGHRS